MAQSDLQTTNYSVSRNTADEPDLLELAKTLLRRIGWIILAALIFGAGAFVLGKAAATTTYRSQFTMLINERASENEAASALTDYDQSLVKACAEIITSDTVLQAAADADVNFSCSQVTTDVSADTGSITVYVQANTPEEALQAAQDIAEQAQTQIAAIFDGISIYMINQPSQPQTITSSYTKTTVVVAFIGAFLACAVIVLLYILDDSLRSEKKLGDKYDIPVIGVIPNYNAAAKESGLPTVKSDKTLFLCLREDSPFAFREAYYTLRAKVTFSLPGISNAVIGITGGGQGVGTSSAAVNLALAFSELGKKVLIIDADLRKPSVASMLDIKAAPGLCECLRGTAAMQDCLCSAAAENVDVLPAGDIPLNPTKLLQSEKMSELLQAARDQYDYVILDLPPVNSVSDAALVSQKLDGYLLTVRHSQTNCNQIESMLQDLCLADAKILGFVYNDAPTRKKD